MNRLDAKNKFLLEPEELNFVKVPGKVTPHSEAATGLEPLIKVRRDNFDLKGFQSGMRSGIIIHNGKLMKIKGCDLDVALHSQGTYRETYGMTKEPHGGLLKTEALREIEVMEAYNEIAKQEGFPIIQKPVAIIDYNKQFLADIAQNSSAFNLASNIMGNTLFDATFNMFSARGDLVGLVTEIEGDTRLNDFFKKHWYSTHEKYENPYSLSQRALTRELLDLAHKIGTHVGALKRVTEKNIIWGVGNANDGNVVLINKDDEIHIGMTDFDESTLIGTKTSYIRKAWARLAKESEKKQIKMYFMPADMLADSFRKGFDEGYVSPDKRKPISFGFLKLVA